MLVAMWVPRLSGRHRDRSSDERQTRQEVADPREEIARLKAKVALVEESRGA
jgi:hypothetical protein